MQKFQIALEVNEDQLEVLLSALFNFETECFNIAEQCEKQNFWIQMEQHRKDGNTAWTMYRAIRNQEKVQHGERPFTEADE